MTSFKLKNILKITLSIIFVSLLGITTKNWVTLLSNPPSNKSDIERKEDISPLPYLTTQERLKVEEKIRNNKFWINQRVNSYAGYKSLYFAFTCSVLIALGYFTVVFINISYNKIRKRNLSIKQKALILIKSFPFYTNAIGEGLVFCIVVISYQDSLLTSFLTVRDVRPLSIVGYNPTFSDMVTPPQKAILSTKFKRVSREVLIPETEEN